MGLVAVLIRGSAGIARGGKLVEMPATSWMCDLRRQAERRKIARLMGRPGDIWRRECWPRLPLEVHRSGLFVQVFLVLSHALDCPLSQGCHKAGILGEIVGLDVGKYLPFNGPKIRCALADHLIRLMFLRLQRS